LLGQIRSHGEKLLDDAPDDDVAFLVYRCST
jgi:hypothetical protein